MIGSYSSAIAEGLRFLGSSRSHLQEAEYLLQVDSFHITAESTYLLTSSRRCLAQSAIVGFTKGLAEMLMVQKGIRVNAVAPGPIWTPITVESFTPAMVRHRKRFAVVIVFNFFSEG